MNVLPVTKPKVRRPPVLDFTGLPRHWYYGNAWLTHSTNALNLLFPMGERFFIRSVKAYLDELEDPELRERCRLFFGQEAQHGRAHEQMYEMLESQGFEVRSFLAWYERWAFERIEASCPRSVCLSVTVALEHLTAMLGEHALERDHLDAVPEPMAVTLRWHSCEEIEHKSVAFDVFEEVDGRYELRVVGMFVALGLLFFFWGAGQRHLLAQEGLSWREKRRLRAAALAKGVGHAFIKEGLLPYMRRGFHPDDVDNRQLAADWLSANGF